MMNDFSQWHTLNYTGNNYENVVQGVNIIDNMKNTVNLLLLIILIIGLILGIYLIYHKHKGEKGVWKRFLKWSSIFFLIIAIIWIIVSVRFWQIGGIGGEAITH